MIDSFGYAVKQAKVEFTPLEFKRRDLRPSDVLIDIMYCGICHSDIHKVKNEWGNTVYPLVPGHEIIGRVVSVGSSVKKFKAGDIAGVGVMVDSCGKCEYCKAGEENCCRNGFVGTYNYDEPYIGGRTYGGYSKNIVAPEKFTFRIAPNADLAATAPLLCAGVTTYVPLKRWKVGKGTKVGIVGLGGLGHMGVKLAHSFGAHVVVLTSSENKIKDAMRLGANEVLLWKNKNELEKHKVSFNFILDTVSAPHDVNQLLGLLDVGGAIVVVGIPSTPHSIDAGMLIGGHKILAGSGIGGTKETQEMLDYCAKNGIKSDIELIPITKLKEAYDRTEKSDVKYRFVIDMSSLKK